MGLGVLVEGGVGEGAEVGVYDSAVGEGFEVGVYDSAAVGLGVLVGDVATGSAGPAPSTGRPHAASSIIPISRLTSSISTAGIRVNETWSIS
jgi:hypothetical protein